MTFKPKTFPVKTGDGQTLQATQLATFTRYIKNVQFRFVVTQLPSQDPVVTHRATGMKVVDISPTMMASCRGNATDAGYATLTNFVTEKGEERIYEVLTKAEKALQQNAAPATPATPAA